MDNSDFKSWYLENVNLIDNMHAKNSILFEHVKDIIDSLAYINDKIEKEEDENLDFDYDGIFDAGYSYLFSYISEIKVYLKNYFDNNINLMLKYDLFLVYYFYINDIKDLLISDDKYTDEAKKDVEYVLDDIDKVLKDKGEIDHKKIDDYNMHISSIIPDNWESRTIPEIFSDVKDKLEM